MSKETGHLLDGLSRDERLIRELLPEFIEIEDRDTTDLLKVMSDLSRHLIYFNDSNGPQGNWDGFFKTDFNILNNLITKFDLQGYLKYFYQLEVKLERAVNDDDVLEALKKIFYFIFAAAVKMHELSTKLLAVHHLPFFTGRLDEIIKKIENVIAHLRAYNHQALLAFAEVFIEDEAFDQEGFVARISVQEIFNKEKGVSESTGDAFKDIKTLFNTLRTTFNRVLNACRYYVTENPIEKQTYSPHLALVIAFLELYGYLKTGINELPKKHLEFYYHKILGFNRLPATPDQVNLLFDPLPDAKQVVLEKGVLVSGNIPELKDEVHYELDHDIVLSKAHISSLKTLFSVRTERITSIKDISKSISEVQLYRAEYPNPEPKFIVKHADQAPSWPMLGQDINELTTVQRKDSIAETGLLVASPILYQQSASRKILIKFFISEDSYDNFSEYLKNYQMYADSAEEDVEYTLLENTFVVEFTGPEGWEKPRFKRIVLQKQDNSLMVELYQEKTDLPFAIYSAVHGSLPDLKWPAIRLLVNNETNFNPLVYLQYIKIERITIVAKVSGLTDYTLQNNIGSLSNAAAFQPFGPFSPAGSYFDIVNANIFNKFLSKVQLRLEWSGLPTAKGGFETHYQHYGVNLKNSSFRVRLLSPKNADTITARVNNDFPLFESDLNASFEQVLKHSTTFKKEVVDVKELAYINSPVLEQEEQFVSGEMSEGTLRVEFTGPRFAFGHSTFANVFSETALHNARRFVKKRPLPEQPYTPLLNNVFLDYTQTATEQLNNAAGNMEEFNTITLIHLQPFGYEQVFPGKIKPFYRLVPIEENDSNFYIGFDKITPGEEISILFHLEEKTSHELAVKVQPLNWSYLYQNSWIGMNDKYVLSDTTENLITTGIVRLIVPEDIDLGNSIMPGEMFWMRVSTVGRDVVRSRIKALYVNAVPATRIVEKDAQGVLELPAGVLKSFLNPVKGVQNIWQLFPSFGGRAAENAVEFYIRVSQRIRHKNRLLMSLDIEQTVLENFPEVLIAKCIRNEEGRVNERSDISGLRLILVALSENAGLPNLRPMVSLDTLCNVKDFLQPRLSPQVTISVENPVYERVKVVCKVRLVSEKHADNLYYIKHLENDINEFISPWYFRKDINYRIGRKLFVSEMLAFIKAKPYISSVEDFGLAHFYNYNKTKETGMLTNMNDSKLITSGYLSGSVSEAIFIPADTHFIEIVELPERKEEPDKIGLSHLRVGDELFIGEDAEKEDAEAEDKSKQYYNWVISKNN